LPRPESTRRDFIRWTASALMLSGFAAPGLRAARAGVAYAYVGTYTPNGGGIYLFLIDRATGEFAQLQVVDDIRNPTWLAVNPAQDRLYAVSEIDNYDGSHNGAVMTYAIDAETRQLTRLGAVNSAGGTPAHVSVHPSGKFAFAANYGGGNVAVFPVAANGVLGEPCDVRPGVGARHPGRAADDPSGQFGVSDHDSPHPHMVAPDPSGQFVIANDAGLDLTLVWRFDAKAGRLLPADVPVVSAPSGAAPRHFAFHPNGRWFYNLYEHDAKVAVYDYDAARRAAPPADPLGAAAQVCRQRACVGNHDRRRRPVSVRVEPPARRLERIRGRGRRPAATDLGDVVARRLAALHRHRCGRRSALLMQSKGRLDHLVSNQRRDRRPAVHRPLRTGGKPRVHDVPRPLTLTIS
jgi:6-phosphogluconolactonase (cycloisomerase 2 family)